MSCWQFFLQLTLQSVHIFDFALLGLIELFEQGIALVLDVFCQQNLRIVTLLNKELDTLDSQLSSVITCFWSSDIQIRRVLRDNQHFLEISPSRSFKVQNYSRSSRNLDSIYLISSETLVSSWVILFVIISCWSSFCWFCLCWVMVCSFCSIFSSRYRFYSFCMFGICLKSSWRESRLRDILFYSIQTIIIPSECLTVMIYMRDRAVRKKTEGPELAKRLIIDEIKQKISQGLMSNKKNLSEDKQPVKGENERHQEQRQRFQIFKKDHQRKVAEVFPQQRMCQSIVIDSEQKMLNSEHVQLKKRVLSVQKCFDVQIVNMLGSRLKFQTYIKMLESQNHELKQQIQHLESKMQTLSKEAIELSEVRANQLQFRLQEECQKNLERQNRINKYYRCFQEGKNTLLNACMKLIQAKNCLGTRLDPNELQEKQQGLSECLQKSEKMISVYSNFLQGEYSSKPKEGLILQQLTSIVKCQQKTIEKLTQNRKKDGQIHRQNVLLRYETNRLANQIQQLLGLLAEAKKQAKQQKWQSAPKKGNKTINNQQQYSSFCQTEPLQSTPVQRLIEVKSPDEGLSKIAEYSQYSSEEIWRSQVTEKESRIKNLQIQKEYLSDQLISVEKDFEDLQRSFRQVNEEKIKLENEVQILKEDRQRLEREVQIFQEQENVTNDQIGLLKQKIRHLQEKGQQIKGSQPAKSRYLDEPEPGQVVTIQSLLKFFKKKQLHRFHDALMDLIARYEQRISELNNSFKSEKEMKEKLLTFSRSLYSMVTSGGSLSLQSIVLQISKYEEIISGLHQNRIDILLRQVKSFSIGIDRNEYENICSELEDYVYHLKSRLPTLSEQYFQDGSSVADSCVGQMSPIMI